MSFRRVVLLFALLVGGATTGCQRPDPIVRLDGAYLGADAVNPRDLTADSDAQVINLVDLKSFDPTLVIEAKYSTNDNFFGRRIYPENRVFLEESAARHLKAVQQRLRKRGMGLKVFDGYRPHRVQFRFWELVPDPRYVADPKKGSRHNRGAAVDVTLVDLAGNELPMPTEYDDFTEKAHHDYVRLRPDRRTNRQILRDAMLAEGFEPLATEWWHYDAPGWRELPIFDVNPYGKPLLPDD